MGKQKRGRRSALLHRIQWHHFCSRPRHCPCTLPSYHGADFHAPTPGARRIALVLRPPSHVCDSSIAHGPPVHDLRELRVALRRTRLSVGAGDRPRGPARGLDGRRGHSCACARLGDARPRHSARTSIRAADQLPIACAADGFRAPALRTTRVRAGLRAHRERSARRQRRRAAFVPARRAVDGAIAPCARVCGGNGMDRGTPSSPTPATFRARITNLGTDTWPAAFPPGSSREYAVELVAEWLPEEGSAPGAPRPEPARVPLRRDLLPGETISQQVTIGAPAPGGYVLSLVLEQRGGPPFLGDARRRWPIIVR
jgi:hypothetical protein